MPEGLTDEQKRFIRESLGQLSAEEMARRLGVDAELVRGEMRHLSELLPAGRKAHIFAVIAIIVLGFLVYSNTFQASWHFDDKPAIVENPLVKRLDNFWPLSTWSVRYFGYLTFALNYKIGRLNVVGYHIVNISIHILAAIMLYSVVLQTMRSRYARGRPGSMPLPEHLALIAALIFVAHPIQTQAVTYIVQRFASMAGMFYLASMALFIKARRLNQEGVPFFSGRHLAFYIGSLVTIGLGMFTKEIMITIPAMIVLYDCLFIEQRATRLVLSWLLINLVLKLTYPHPLLVYTLIACLLVYIILFLALNAARRGQAGEAGDASPPGGFKGAFLEDVRRLPYMALYILSVGIIPSVTWGLKKPLGDVVQSVGRIYETLSITPKDYLLTQFNVLLTYIRLLFLPINQNLDYDYPVAHSLFEPFTNNLFHLPTVVSLLVLAAIVAFAVYMLPRSRLIAFGIFWFFLTASVESSIIPIRDVIFEHRVYLPSAGFALFLAVAIHQLCTMAENWYYRRRAAKEQAAT